MRASTPPAAMFEDHETSNSTVTDIVNVPPAWPADDFLYVYEHVLWSSERPRRHSVPGPVHVTWPPSPIVQTERTGRATTVEETAPAEAVAE